VIRVFVIGMALLYGHALIVCVVPEDGVLPGEKLLSVSAEFDSVPFRNTVRHAVHEKTAVLNNKACSLRKAHRL